MSQLLEPLQNLCRDKNIAGLIVHHTGKVPEGGKVDPFDTIRGSSAIRATCRGVWVLAPEDKNYRLCVENGWGKHDLKIRLDPDTLLWTLLGKWTPENVNQTQQEKVLDYLNKVVSTSIDVLNEVLDIPKSSLYVVLRRLQHEGIVHKRGSGVHSVYTRKSIEQIEQLNNLLDLCNADEARDRDGSNKNSKTLLDPQKSGQLPKSGQNSVHFSDSLSTPSTGDFVRSELDPLPDKEYSDLTNIEQGLNKDPKSGQSDQTDDPLSPIPVDPNVEYEEW
jgi:DNA-binding transcriptional ArsR family regulator